MLYMKSLNALGELLSKSLGCSYEADELIEILCHQWRLLSKQDKINIKASQTHYVSHNHPYRKKVRLFTNISYKQQGDKPIRIEIKPPNVCRIRKNRFPPVEEINRRLQEILE